MRKLDPKVMLDDLRRVFREAGAWKFSYCIYKTQGRFTTQSFVNHFGSWNQACGAAGLPIRQLGRPRLHAAPRIVSERSVTTPKKDAPLLEHVRGRRRCLKCERVFDSWDVKKNRICEPCNGVNASIEEGPYQKVAI